MGKKPKRNPWQPSEAVVKEAIMQALAFEQAQGRVTWYGRFNCGRLFVPPKRQKTDWYWAVIYWIRGVEYRKGFSDVAGQLSDGRFFCFEVKKPGITKGSDEQHNFVDTAIGGGAIGGLVSDAGEVIEMIRGAFR